MHCGQAGLCGRRNKWKRIHKGIFQSKKRATDEVHVSRGNFGLSLQPAMAILKRPAVRLSLMGRQIQDEFSEPETALRFPRGLRGGSA